jgi:hypothetical protein
LLDQFEFNGECHEISTAADWLRNPSSDFEWLILLHKFYYAPGLGIAYSQTGDTRYAAKWVELTSAWIDSVPLRFLSSDVAGRRIQNWIYAQHYFVTPFRPKCVTADFYCRFLQSLHAQLQRLRENLTPARNHRTLELYSLFLAAVAFTEFSEASEWLEFATRELLLNVRTDLLPDGVHCELSFDYHHIVLRNYLAARRVAALNDIPMPLEMDELIQKALRFSVYAHNPNGIVPALSDGDRTDFRYLLEQGYELYGSPEMLYVASKGERGVPPAERAISFPDGGYVFLRSGWGERMPYEDELHLVFDCGPLGAGNHGHFDLLNFEMAAYGRTLIVDPGRYTYDESGDVNFRALFRGTGYHNTVRIDGKNQTRYEFRKRKFKVTGPEPDRELRAFVTGDKCDYIHGIARSHEYSVLHERKICFVRPHYWVICDELRADDTHEYDVLFHLMPGALDNVCTSRGGNATRVESPGLILAQPYAANVSVNILPGYVSPVYGLKEPVPIVSFRTKAADARFLTVVYPYKDQPPHISIEPLSSGATGLRIRHDGESGQTVDDINFAEAGLLFNRCTNGQLASVRYSA